MKNKFIYGLLLLTTLSYAGEYESYCYSKFHKMEVYGCLDKIQTKAQAKLDKKIETILKNTSSYSRLTKKDFDKASYAFESHVEKQCGILAILPSGSGIGHIMQDCEIKMINNRIKELDYLFGNL